MPDVPERRKGTDPHAPRSALYPVERPVPEYYYPPDDDVDGYCVACTPELGEHGWQHDRVCPRRQRRTA